MLWSLSSTPSTSSLSQSALNASGSHDAVINTNAMTSSFGSAR